MPRSCPTGLYNHLQQNCTTLATCIKFIRTDGVNVCMTTCGQELTIGGDVYQYVAGFEPTALQAQVGGGGDIEVSAILNSGAINASDVLAGRYSGALVEVFWVNYLAVDDGQMLLLTAVIGDISLGDLGVKITIKDIMSLLKQTVGEQYSSCCRVRNFGDSQCDPGNGLDIAQYRKAWTVSNVISNFQIQFTAGTATPSGNYYTFGKCTFTSGNNNGIMRSVAADVELSGTTCSVTLYEPFPLAVNVGDTVVLEKGCGRLFENCQSFPSSTNTSGNNSENFRGEPFLPGNNQLIQVGR